MSAHGVSCLLRQGFVMALEAVGGSCAGCFARVAKRCDIFFAGGFINTLLTLS